MKFYRHKQKRRRSAAIAGTVVIMLSVSSILLLLGSADAFYNPGAILFGLSNVLLSAALIVLSFKLHFSPVTIDEKGVSSNVLYHKRIFWEECADIGIRKTITSGAVIYYLYFSKNSLNEKQKKDAREIKQKKLRDGLIDIEYREEVLEAVWKYAPSDLIADFAQKIKGYDLESIKKSH
jgi:hypothetical protein